MTHKCVHTHRRMRFENWNSLATNQGMPAATRGEEVGKDPWTSRGSTTLLTPWFQPRDTDFRILSSRIVKKEISVILRHSVCDILLKQQREMDTPGYVLEMHILRLQPRPTQSNSKHGA